MQKTVLSPFFEASEKSIHRILKQPSKILYNRFYKNMDIALQKLGANAYTKTIRQLLDNNKIFLGYSGVAVNSEVPVFSVYIGDSHILAGIIPDIVRCSPDTANDIVQIIKKLEKISKEIIILQKKLDDKSIEKVVELKNESEQLQETLATMLDYPRIAEAIYFSFIRYIVAELDRGSSIKLFELSIELFKKILNLSLGSMMTVDDRTTYNAAIDYVFTISFTNLNPREVLHNISKRYGQETADLLAKNGITSVKSMEQITSLLGIIKVINITPIAFNNIIAKRFGTSVLSMLYGTYDYFVAWATVSAHHSVLFNMGPIDKEIQIDIEKIILNYKSKVR